MRLAIKYAARAASAVMLGAVMVISTAQAQDQTMDQDRDRTRDQTQLQDPIKAQDRDRDQIYGSQLMTRKERAEYQKQMRALKTEQEREQFRLEHHKKMQERAQAQGKTLPDMPQGRGPARAAGGAAGPGGGVKRN